MSVLYKCLYFIETFLVFRDFLGIFLVMIGICLQG